VPKKNGNDVLKHLRANNRYAQTLVPIASGYFRKPSEYAEFTKRADRRSSSRRSQVGGERLK
jgi:hypothetical protein